MTVFVGDFWTPSAAVVGALWVLSQANPGKARELSSKLGKPDRFLEDIGLNKFCSGDMVKIWRALSRKSLGMFVPELVFYSLCPQEGTVLDFLRTGNVNTRKFNAIHAGFKWVVVGPELERTEQGFIEKLAPEGGTYALKGLNY